MKRAKTAVASAICLICALFPAFSTSPTPATSPNQAPGAAATPHANGKPARVPMGVEGVKAAAAAASRPSPKAVRDPRAVDLVAALRKAVERERAWDKMAGLRFTQAFRHDGKVSAEFRHLWDLKRGLHRVQGPADDGGERDVFFNPSTRKGEGWVRVFINPAPEPGKPAPAGGTTTVVRWFHPPGQPQTAYLNFGYERYLNDTYWLLFPLKLEDPRIELSYEAEESLDGEPHDIVKVVLPKELELTTGRTYWIYLNRKTHLIDKWQYPSQVAGAQPAGKRDPSHTTSWLWQEWKDFGPLHLSTQRTDPASGDSVIYKDVEVLSSIPEKAFEPPTKPRSPELVQLKPATDKKATAK